MLEESKRRQIIAELEKATVKVFIFKNIFKGSGFFVSADGYILTAYHCIGDDATDIVVESPKMGKFRASLDEEKSLRHPQHDIAVLKIQENINGSYVPLGFVNRQHITDEILALGFPLEWFATIPGRILSINDHHFLNDAMKGPGQSGGLVYHFSSNRVIGLALSIYQPDKFLNGGLAGRFDLLFDHWPELKKINQNSQLERLTKNNSSYVVCLSGIYQGEKFPLMEGKSIVFGRDPKTANIVFPATFLEISRRHAKLTYSPEKREFVLQDLGSTKGTFIFPSKKLLPNEKVTLKLGDRFYLASSNYLFQVIDS